MISIAAFTGVKQYLNHVHYFVSNRVSALTRERRHPLHSYLNDSPVFLVENFRTTRAFEGDQSVVLEIKFRPSVSGAKNFVLLRGLFEFSRPKGINISSDVRDRSFELRLPEEHVPAAASYLQTISERFHKEIAFKASLKEIIHFENSVKAGQARLYQSLMASA